MTPPVWVTRLCHRYPQRSICTPLILSVAQRFLISVCYTNALNVQSEVPKKKNIRIQLYKSSCNTFTLWERTPTMENDCRTFRKLSPPSNFYVWTYREDIYVQDPILKRPLVTRVSDVSCTTTAVAWHPNNIGSTFKHSKYRPLATTTLTIQSCTQQFRWLYTVVMSLWAIKPLRGMDVHKRKDMLDTNKH